MRLHGHGGSTQKVAGAGEVRDVDVMALWFARRLAWIVCIMMFSFGFAVMGTTIAPGRIASYGTTHEGLFASK